jgi:hypothetical protein
MAQAVLSSGRQEARSLQSIDRIASHRRACAVHQPDLAIATGAAHPDNGIACDPPAPVSLLAGAVVHFRDGVP